MTDAERPAWLPSPALSAAAVAGFCVLSYFTWAPTAEALPGIVVAARSTVQATSVAGLLAAAGALHEERSGRSLHPVTSSLVRHRVGRAAVAPGALWLEILPPAASAGVSVTAPGGWPWRCAPGRGADSRRGRAVG